MGTTGSKVGRHNWKGRNPRITDRGRVWAIGTAGLQVSARQQEGRDHSIHTKKQAYDR
jgi:hypothetical protein